MTAPASELEDEIAYLRDLDLRGLRATKAFGVPPQGPDHLPRHLHDTFGNAVLAQFAENARR